jgi:hypothetical protein
MSYNTIHTSSQDEVLLGRITACCAQEHKEPLTDLIWSVYVAQDVEAAYASALAAENPNPGGDEGVVTDGMILSHVQAFGAMPLVPAPT